MKEKPPVVYVLPHFSSSSTEHYAHAIPFLQELGKRTNLAVIIERSSGAPDLSEARRVEVLPQGWPPLLRMMALVWRLLHLRLAGYKTIFVRISIPAALAAATVGRLTGMRSFYWSSGQGKNGLPDWSQDSVKRMRQEIELIPFYLATTLVHHVVTGPEGMADYYARHYHVNRSKIRILHNDIDVPAFSAKVARSRPLARRNLGLPDDAEIMLFVGRVSRLKGGAYLLPIAERVLVQRPKAVLLAAGAFVLPGIKEAWERHPLRDRIVLLGAVPNADVAQFYAAADLFILPSVSEGFPRVLLECMAAGLPFVGFDVGGVREIASAAQGAYIVPPGDIRSFAEKALELLADPARRQVLGSSGRERVEAFSSPRVADLFVERVAA